jgi:hypothetical protein
VITGAFEGKDNLSTRASLDVVERQPQRTTHRPAYIKGPGLLIDHGPVVMRDAEESFVWRKPTVQVFPPGLILNNAGGGGGNWRGLVGPGNHLLSGSDRECTCN